MANTVAAAAFIILSLSVYSGVAQTNAYDNCSTNYTVLEQAYYNTEHNLFRTWETFYPPRDLLPSYVRVTYTFQSQGSTADVEDEHYIWTVAFVYLIQPPTVFRFTSLFLSYASEDRVKELTLFLPYECQGLKNTTKDDESNYLEVLTHRLKLYAQARGGDLFLTDDYHANAVRDSHVDFESEDRLNHTVNILTSSLLLVPQLFECVMVMWLVKGARSKIRKCLAQSKPAVHATLASVVITSFFFSLYILTLDAAAVVYAVKESNNQARYSNYRHNPLLWVPFVTLGMDCLAFLAGFFMLILASTCIKNERVECCFNCWLCCVFCWPKFRDQYKENDRAEEQKLWLLSGFMIAPIFCIGSHLTYIVLAWITFPLAAGGVFLFYTVLFAFNFLVFRQLYLVMIDHVYRRRFYQFCNCIRCRYKKMKENHPELGTPNADERESNKQVEEDGFSYGAICIELLLGFLIIIVEIWLLVGVTMLPINNLAENANFLYAFTTTVILFVGGLVSYKIFNPNTTSIRSMNKMLHETYYYLWKKNRPNRTQPQGGEGAGSTEEQDIPTFNTQEEGVGALRAMFLFSRQHELSESEREGLYKSVFRVNCEKESSEQESITVSGLQTEV